MRRSLLALLLAAPLAAGCLTARTATSGPVEWGSSFGMCVGYCSARLVVEGGTATLTETGTRSPELAPRVRARALTPAETAALADARTASQVATDTLGCPDCADGGAEYVEMNGQRVIFEFGADAGAATPLAEALRAIRQTFPSDPSGR
jgi:hypothetical protein